MRVLIDATATDPGPSGARTRLVYLLGEYFRLPRRHDVIVITPRGRGLTSMLAERGVECVEADPAPPARERWSRPVAWWDGILRSFRADALQAETLPVPRTTAPLLLTLHDLRDLTRPPFDPRAFYARVLLPRELTRVERVIAVSDDTARLVASHGRFPRDRVSVVWNAPDPNVRRDPDPALRSALYQKFALPDRFVLALGHVEPRKNLAVLIRAVRALRADPRFHDLGVVLCGRDVAGEGDRLKALASRTPAVPFLLTGQLVDDAKNALLDLALCVATPSFVEGFGIVPLEAMAAGVPVVAARASALPEVLADAALFHAPDDPIELAERLARVIADDSTRERLLAAGKLRAASFTWQSSALALRDAHDAVAVERTEEPLGTFLTKS